MLSARGSSTSTMWAAGSQCPGGSQQRRVPGQVQGRQAAFGLYGALQDSSLARNSLGGDIASWNLGQGVAPEEG